MNRYGWHVITIGEAHVAVRFWRPAVIITWPMFCRECRREGLLYGVGQRMTALGVRPGWRRRPHLRQYVSSPMHGVHALVSAERTEAWL